jgi:hypothetical protein
MIAKLINIIKPSNTTSTGSSREPKKPKGMSKLYDWAKSCQYQIFLAICIVLVSFISYNLGKITSGEKGSISVVEGLPGQAGANIYKAASAPGEGSGDVVISPRVSPRPLDIRVVVSRASDSKKYHYSWCASAKKIKLENQMWFNSDREAEASGYTLAGNCAK